jgi:hypothetical protein
VTDYYLGECSEFGSHVLISGDFGPAAAAFPGSVGLYKKSELSLSLECLSHQTVQEQESAMLTSRNVLMLTLLGFGVMPIHPATAAPLTNDQISRQIVGKVLTGNRNGISVRMSYEPDGTVRMRAMFISGSGTWSYAENGLCMEMTSGPKRGRTCVTFEHLGGKTYRNSEGVTLTVQD